MPSLAKKRKVGNRRFIVVHYPECPVCTAVDSNANPLRETIDKYLIKNTLPETERMIRDLGIYISPNTLKTHLNKHSPYIETTKALIKEAAEKAAMGFADQLNNSKWQPEDVLQKIIDIGGHKVTTGEIPVDGRLLMNAMKEQGSRKQSGTLEELLRNMDRKRFAKEGQVVDEPESDVVTTIALTDNNEQS